MSRVAKKPITLAKGVEYKNESDTLTVKGPKGTLSLAKPAGVEITLENGVLNLSSVAPGDDAITGTIARFWPTWSRACPKASSASWIWSAWVTAPPCRART